MGAPSQQTVTQKTEIDPIQKAFLFGTPLPEEYRAMMFGQSEPAPGQGGVAAPPLSNEDLLASGAIGRANGGIVGLAGGGMVPSQMPDLSNRETAYLMGAQALQDAMSPQMGYAMGGLIEGPGTGTSDDIPATIYQNGMPVDHALLSNGEVVLSRKDLANMAPDGNADTAAQMVGNAPNGTRGQKAAEMYAMVEGFRNGGLI